MQTMTKVAIAVIGLLVVGGGIMLAIYLLNGGEGESTNIPGNPSEVVTLRLG
jgi:hypothetical protein